MTKLMIITLLAATTLSVNAFRNPKQTRYIHQPTLGGNAVSIDRDLFVLSHESENSSVIDLIPVDGSLYKPCKIHLSSSNESFKGRIKATALWRKLVVWGRRRYDSSRDYEQGNFTILMLDPRTCTHKTLLTLVDSAPMVSIEPQVITYRDRVDIFYPGYLNGCMPCKFDINGNPLETEYTLKYQLNSQIGTIGRKMQRYVFSYEQNNEKSVVQLLDHRFVPIVVSHSFQGITIKDVAVKSVGKNGFAGMVFVPQKKPSRQPQYTLFNGDLESMFTNYVPLLDGHSLEKSYVDIDSHGNSYVTLVQSQDQTSNSNVTLVRYNVDGDLVDEILLTTRAYHGVKVRWDEHTLMIDDQEYCLIERCRSGSEITQIRCIDVSRRI